MILDLQSMFSGSVAADGTKTGQGITATAISSNVMDLRQPNGAPALVDNGIIGGDLWLVVIAQTAAAGGDAAKTLTITLESDSAAGMATAPVVHYSTPAILGSAITAGATLVRILMPSADYKRFLGVRYTVSAGFTSFNILAFLTPDVQRNVIYPIGYTLDA